MAESHGRGLLEISHLAKVTAVCDIVEERAMQAAKILDAPFVTTDYKEMVDHVDAVIIVLPHDLHYESECFYQK